MSRADLVGQKLRLKLFFGLIGPPVYWEDGRFEIKVFGQLGPPISVIGRKPFEAELGKVVQQIKHSLREF